MKTVEYGLGGFSILQLPNSTDVQMMGFVVTSPSGKTLVIDGGCSGDAGYLKEVLAETGSHVDLWLLTHCHYDHFSALCELLDEGSTAIEKICCHFPPREWIYAAEPHEKRRNERIFAEMDAHPELFRTVWEGDVMELDGMRIDVLNDPMDFQRFTEPSPNSGSSINDTSLVFRLAFTNGKTALFLGDLGLRAGDVFAQKYREQIKSDIVQMAHHGQNGAGENVYRLIQPDICLWPAPMWLYDNDRGGGFDTAHYKTVTVRGWMERLGVKEHLVEGMGAARIV